MTTSKSIQEFAKAVKHWFASESKPGEFNWATTATQALDGKDLTGKVAVVTGANTGIGKETARALLEANATVIMASRSVERGEAARQEILSSAASANPDDRLKLLQLDLGDLASVKSFSDEFNTLDLPCHYMVQNAGLAATEYKETKHGLELQFGVNHIGHFQLANLLLPRMKQDPPSRLICTTSIGHGCAPDMNEWVKTHGGDKPFGTTPEETNGKGLQSYGISKIANVMFAQEFSRRFSGDGITAASCHPGAIVSNLGRDMPWIVQKIFAVVTRPFSKTESQGAATQVRLVAMSDDEFVPGAYYEDCQPHPYLKPEINFQEGVAVEDTPQYRLWELSEQIIADLGF